MPADAQMFGLQDRRKDSGVRRRLLLATTALSGAALLLSATATQIEAWRLGYHPGLGRPWLSHVYAPWSWWTWQHAPWASQAAPAFALAKAAVYALAAVIGLAVFVVANRARHKPLKNDDVHGTAHFGTEEDLREAGLLPPVQGMPWDGIYVGAWEHPDGTLEYLRHDGPEHVIGIGPVRSGKGLGLVATTQATWPHSMVTYDEKGEQWEMSAGWRKAEAGSTVMRWAPGEQDDTVSFNFLAEVRLGTEFEFGDVSNIMEMIADPKGIGLNDHWDPSAAQTLNGVALHICYEKRAAGTCASIADVLHAMSDPNRSRDALYTSMIANRHCDGQPHPEIAATGQDMMNKDAKERSGIHSTATRMLRLFRDPIVRRNTATSDFRIMDLMNARGPVSLYIVTRGRDKLRLRPLVRLFLTMMFGTLQSADPKMVGGRQVMPHRHRLLVMLDELPSLGKMEVIEDAMGKCAGFGIKVFPLIQDREQLLAAYGQHEGISTLCHIKAAYAPNSVETGKWLSSMSGTATVVVPSVTESGPKGSTMNNVSRTYQQISRPLITPDEVMRMKPPKKGRDGQITEPGHVLIFTQGRPVTLATQSLYFRDPEFVRRIAIPAPPTQRLRTSTP